ncbi:tRNA threonylcarbamoyladenosine biosynthesis protein TsaE [Nocardiopsis mwathae]|uniref:tRNA threonylcarbamoyladenosine biosynthesis protein TsaE n=1 Tax=Nocardiopsis mwathae TaxID=1472723 RepID=A0A7X0D396_9ACTN|nr:tRNA (adenosine(37)-N6)-threonylcarbamoyltransferase complex ATPase subunit type 1 TsaE [Nocardiopsis mwathae]MBB6169968.1 tRNA threonylcarbamoyladenosine biosynthesis protein TsaE [Nocardiopsis mwathae]
MTDTTDTTTLATGALVTAATDADMRALGRRIAGLLRPGDLLIMSGPLGAGKTTLTQGIADGLDVRGPVTSPTFVIARVHPPLSGGPALVHVDAYRLGSAAEVDDLDLEASLDDAVTIVEWGEGVAEELSDDRLEISIDRLPDDTRTVRLTGVGVRWADALPSAD